MLNFCKDEVEPSSFLHCIYIFMKKLLYSQSIRNLSFSIIIVVNTKDMLPVYSPCFRYICVSSFGAFPVFPFSRLIPAFYDDIPDF